MIEALRCDPMRFLPDSKVAQPIAIAGSVIIRSAGAAAGSVHQKSLACYARPGYVSSGTGISRERRHSHRW